MVIMQERPLEVVIIGAGPYGLAAAAHLRAAGLQPHVFGVPMEFWQTQMPEGMLLRSGWEASFIGDPRTALTLDAYQAARGSQVGRPVPLNDFVAYGQWFQSQAVPEVDRRRVRAVSRTANGFRVELEDDESLLAKRVIVAGGIAPFARRLQNFAHLPASLASHTSDHVKLDRFTGRRVLIVGGGQSALETAALIGECGGEAEVIVRRPYLRWLHRKKERRFMPQKGLVRWVDPPTDVGPLGLSWLVAQPDLFRRLPRDVQDRIAYRCIRPAGAVWLPPRLEQVRLTLGRRIVRAEPDGAGLRVELDDGSERRVDHLMQATGYRIDVARYPFLSGEVVSALRMVDGYPALGPGFESSVRGLHFLGAPAARSFGPLMRFVAGTPYTGRALARQVA